MQNKLICGDNLNHTQHQLLDAKLFVTTVINQLKNGSLDSEDAINEICLYMAHIKGHNLASFLRQIVVEKMDGVSFERFIGLMFTLRGYKVEFTPRTGDQGVDLIAARDEERIAIQCKRWKDSVGPEAVQQVFTGKSLYECTKGVLITTASLSPQAERMANKLDITYWDKDSIEVLCEECVKKWGDADDATDIIQRFAPNKKLRNGFSWQDTKEVRDTLEERTERLLDIINGHTNGISRTDLKRKCWRVANASELTKVIDTLVQAGMVRVQTIKSRKNRTKTAYFPTFKKKKGLMTSGKQRKKRVG